MNLFVWVLFAFKFNILNFYVAFCHPIRAFKLSVYFEVELHVSFTVFGQYFHRQLFTVCLKHFVFTLHINHFNFDVRKLETEGLKELQRVLIKSKDKDIFDIVFVEEFKHFKMLGLIPEGQEGIISQQGLSSFIDINSFQVIRRRNHIRRYN